MSLSIARKEIIFFFLYSEDFFILLSFLSLCIENNDIQKAKMQNFDISDKTGIIFMVLNTNGSYFLTETRWIQLCSSHLDQCTISDDSNYIILMYPLHYTFFLLFLHRKSILCKEGESLWFIPSQIALEATFLWICVHQQKESF